MLHVHEAAPDGRFWNVSNAHHQQNDKFTFCLFPTDFYAFGHRGDRMSRLHHREFSSVQQLFTCLDSRPLIILDGLEHAYKPSKLAQVRFNIDQWVLEYNPGKCYASMSTLNCVYDHNSS